MAYSEKLKEKSRNHSAYIFSNLKDSTSTLKPSNTKLLPRVTNVPFKKGYDPERMIHLPFWGYLGYSR